MSGEKNLQTLLGSLSPTLMRGNYVFCSFRGAGYGDYADLSPLASIMEPEGLSLVVAKEKADARGLSYESVYSGITLGVHSSLDAVGLTAAIATVLADRGISANLIAGYYHDHVFVQQQSAGEALEALLSFAVPGP